MSSLMPAAAESGIPYQGASSQDLCPYDRYALGFQSCTHARTVALMAIELLCSDELNEPSFVRVCPFKACKELFWDPKSMIQHIIACKHSVDGEILCNTCCKYENVALAHKEFCSCEKRRKSLRRLTSFFSTRSEHATVPSPCSSRSSSVVSQFGSAGSSPASSPLCDARQAGKQPQNYAPQQQRSELGGCSYPAFAHPVVQHPAVELDSAFLTEMAANEQHLENARCHELPVEGCSGTFQPGPPSPKRRCMPVSPGRIQTDLPAAPPPPNEHEVQATWSNQPSRGEDCGQSFLGNGYSESPTGINYDGPDSLYVFRSPNRASFSVGIIPSPLSIDQVSPFGRACEPQHSPSAWQPERPVTIHNSRTPPLDDLRQEILERHGVGSHMEMDQLHAHEQIHRDGQPSATSLSFTPPPLSRRQLSGDTTISGSTLASTSPYTPSNGPTFDSMGISRDSTLSLLDPEAAESTGCSATLRNSLPRSSKWSCPHPQCDYHPKGKPSKWPAYLRKHKAKHSPKRCQCPECGKMMSRPDNLKTHLKGACRGPDAHLAWGFNGEDNRGDFDSGWFGGIAQLGRRTAHR